MCYSASCRTQKTPEGTPHFVKGMQAEFNVQ